MTSSSALMTKPSRRVWGSAVAIADAQSSMPGSPRASPASGDATARCPYRSEYRLSAEPRRKRGSAVCAARSAEDRGAAQDLSGGVGPVEHVPVIGAEVALLAAEPDGVGAGGQPGHRVGHRVRGQRVGYRVHIDPVAAVRRGERSACRLVADPDPEPARSRGGVRAERGRAGDDDLLTRGEGNREPGRQEAQRRRRRRGQSAPGADRGDRGGAGVALVALVALGAGGAGSAGRAGRARLALVALGSGSAVRARLALVALGSGSAVRSGRARVTLVPLCAGRARRPRVTLVTLCARGARITLVTLQPGDTLLALRVEGELHFEVGAVRLQVRRRKRRVDQPDRAHFLQPAGGVDPRAARNRRVGDPAEDDEQYRRGPEHTSRWALPLPAHDFPFRWVVLALAVPDPGDRVKRRDVRGRKQRAPTGAGARKIAAQSADSQFCKARYASATRRARAAGRTGTTSPKRSTTAGTAPAVRPLIHNPMF